MSRLTAFARPFPAFAAASFPAVGVGAVVCAHSGVPAVVWGRNLGAFVVGGLAAAALTRWAGPRTLRAFAVLTPLGVAATMLGEGQQGVHRWLALGPIHVNAAMLLTPALVVALAVLTEAGARWWLAALVTLSVLVLQPDASQATGFTLALGVVAVGLPTLSARFRWGLAVVAVSLAALSWTRPDPLAPVPEVEEVIGLAARLSPLVAALCVLFLAAAVPAPMFGTRRSPEEPVRRAGRALSALLLVWSWAPALGAFPVPLVGVGVSPILGAWLGVGLLAALDRRGSPATS